MPSFRAELKGRDLIEIISAESASTSTAESASSSTAESASSSTAESASSSTAESASSSRAESALANTEPLRLKVQGCTELLGLVRRHQVQHGKDPRHWPLPTGSSHADLLLREVLLKSRGQWVYPYQHQELCHCRSVDTEIVDQAIVAGAHRCEIVSRQTGASTACGTCRPDVQKIIDFRLKNQAS